MELKRCARCGSFFTSDTEVCQNCNKKDNADVQKLKNFLSEQTEDIIDKSQISTFTGISIKNLDRYLSREEFNNISFINDIQSNNKKITEIV